MKHKIDKLLSSLKGRIPSRGRRTDAVTGESIFLSIKIAGAVLLGMMIAYILCAAADTYMIAKLPDLQLEISRMVAKRSPGMFSVSALAPKRDVTLAPFGVKDKVASASAEKKTVSKPIDQFTLVGTIAPAAAWISVEGELDLVIKSHEFNGYTLTKVDPGSVVFTLGDESYTLYLNYSTGASRPVQKKSTNTEQPAQAAARTDIQNAEFNGKDGAIARELLHELMMNPYGEMGKLRLIPTNSGLMIESMRSDSLLNQLGVKRGDEITGINGIPIKDMPSIMNAMNSMMSGARLDFNVTRDNSPGTLGYVVK